MANRFTSNFVKAQAKLLAMFQAAELRFRVPATYLALRLMSPIMFPNYEELRKREDRTIETNYAMRSKRTLGTGGRIHNHTGTKGDTGTLTPTWLTYDDVFNMSLKQADNNLYNADEQMYQEMSNVVANFMEGYETIATAYIFNNRSGVNIATAEGTFNAVQDVFEIQGNVANRAMQITQIAMDANKYSGQITYFCDSISYALFDFQANQGASNSTNLSFQHNGRTYIHSVELGALAAALATPYTSGFWLAIPMGTVATLPWIPKQNRQGVSTTVGDYTNILNPVDGENYAVHTYETAGDASATNGFTQDVITQYEISQDVSFMKAPLSVVSETTIQAFAIVPQP